jgi:prepilin-type N-terminal cleavage/methylation domain-containing protein
MTPTRRNNQSGVTLMEVLVAMTLLSGLAAGILFSLRIGLNAMERGNSKLMMNRRVMGVERIFQEQVAGYMPAKVDCRVNAEGAVATAHFFEGEPQTMRFVSSYSLQEGNRGYPHILEYQVIPGENGRGVRLVVNELLYTGPTSTATVCNGIEPDPVTGFPTPRFGPVQIGSYSFVLADKLQYCRFLYKDEPPPPQPERWLERWGRARMPSALRVDMGPLDPDPGKLQLVGLTEPIRVNRDIMARYTE